MIQRMKKKKRQILLQSQVVTLVPPHPPCSDLMTIRFLGSTPVFSDGNSPPPLFLCSSFQCYRVYHILLGQVRSTRKLTKQFLTKTLTLTMVQCASITPKKLGDHCLWVLPWEVLVPQWWEQPMNWLWRSTVTSVTIFSTIKSPLYCRPIFIHSVKLSQT